jgi:hypothetical protein
MDLAAVESREQGLMTVGFRQAPGAVPADETARQRTVRLDAEASRLAVAKAGAADGRCIADGDHDAWLEDWERGEPASRPEASSRER